MKPNKMTDIKPIEADRKAAIQVVETALEAESDPLVDFIAAAISKARLQERESAAVICDNESKSRLTTASDISDPVLIDRCKGGAATAIICSALIRSQS